jgi:hypothetical protein
MIDSTQSAKIANYCRELAAECVDDPVTAADKLNALAEAIDNNSKTISGIDIIRAVQRQR